MNISSDFILRLVYEGFTFEEFLFISSYLRFVMFIFIKYLDIELIPRSLPKFNFEDHIE